MFYKSFSKRYRQKSTIPMESFTAFHLLTESKKQLVFIEQLIKPCLR